MHESINTHENLRLFQGLEMDDCATLVHLFMCQKELALVNPPRLLHTIICMRQQKKQLNMKCTPLQGVKTVLKNARFQVLALDLQRGKIRRFEGNVRWVGFKDWEHNLLWLVTPMKHFE